MELACRRWAVNMELMKICLWPVLHLTWTLFYGVIPFLSSLAIFFVVFYFLFCFVDASLLAQFSSIYGSKSQIVFCVAPGEKKTVIDVCSASVGKCFFFIKLFKMRCLVCIPLSKKPPPLDKVELCECFFLELINVTDAMYIPHGLSRKYFLAL